MLAVFNETIRKIFSIIYTSNFIYLDFSPDGITKSILIILMNILVLAIVFTGVYKKRGLKQ
jgi:hypothetical protein